ncbi:2-polyprenyl-6-methoxyphenol hydroxylase-like FAD-dependent oxidoreductase [Amycolatopsis sulphurea]|uniref:2-polyprenyl-6-methoxyphenol hydroxylase-like FAD-dependent oxidoreductase n=1 Tax=Amycolatopsis sulphurea TaxID=76022 RepID=A0A2A9FHR8_9PSEU|nr:FAD-dependent oxidoreductase [Amycolatopsis sulphurea]AHD25942.2 putative oxygenase/cyclase fusion protein [Amycolatopsis sulphurea]PFG50050.1 2-polyprenyl-6-methoxyphenol hydroxylase-like FAD-dependent oxidoreductase [Amycolatopsis sulphurea]
MPEDSGEEPEVLVAGAGPVGLTAAHELARRGVRVRLVDRSAGPATTSRALATHARTLEIWHQMGLLGELLPRGRRVEHFTLHLKGKTLMCFDTNYDTMPTRFPFSLMVDQVVTEEVLRRQVRALGVTVEWGVELTWFDQEPDGVLAELRHADGTVEQVTAAWLVGADGARSTVRKRLDLRLQGDSTQTWLNADVVLDTDLAGDSNHLLHTGRGTLLLVPFPEPGKWRVVDTEDTDHADDARIVRARLADKLTRALGRPIEVPEPSWISVFTVQQRMIDRMRAGRCFVAGDAAHVHSPASGQGMNTGIQDAYNLAWKLADVVRGHAKESLLDSYGAERVPIGETLLRTTRTATALVSLRNTVAPLVMPAGTRLLGALKPLKRRIERTMIRGFCGLTLNYTHSPLSLACATPDGIQPGHRVGCSVDRARTSPGWQGLVTELTDPRWTLLAFADSQEQRQIAAQVERRYGKAVSVRVVAEAATSERVLADPGDDLARDFAMRAGYFVLIRPDGHLAAKGRLSDDLDGAFGALGLVPADAGGDPAHHLDSEGSRMRIIDLSATMDAADRWEANPVTHEVLTAAEGAQHMAAEMKEHFGIDFDPSVLPGGELLTLDTLTLTTHTGTHVDAPSHYGTPRDGVARHIDQMPLEWFLRPGVVLDLTGEPVGAAGADRLREEFERIGYTPKPLDIVLLNTGADALAGSPKYFTDFTGLDGKATELLLDLGVRVIGTDAFSLDAPFGHMIAEYRRTGDRSVLWPAHFAGRDREYCQIEGLTNLAALPSPTGFSVSCLPVKIAGAGAGWTRAVALLD